MKINKKLGGDSIVKNRLTLIVIFYINKKSQKYLFFEEK